MDDKSFGALVKAYRLQRGWKQEDLAAAWKHSREYVSLVERGKRKLDSEAQVARLAEILDIPPAKLEAVGRALPQAKTVGPLAPSEGDDALFQALLAPAQTTIKLSWIVWNGDNSPPDIVSSLETLIQKLDDALTKYRGVFVKPAQELEAYAHEMLGKIAFDQLRFQEAAFHFQEMYDLGEELQNPDLLTLAMTHQGDLLRKRGRYETAFRRFEMARTWSEQANPFIRGTWYKVLARTYSVYGDEQNFLRTIDQAQNIVENTPVTLDTLSNQFDQVEVLQERAQGHTILWQPQKALEIYQETDRLRPFRPLRDLGSYTIVKAQAHTYAGNVDEGVKLAIAGVQMAKSYHSSRHVSRIQGMYDRLSVTPLGKSPRMKDLREALATI